jgi:hypothetical protein
MQVPIQELRASIRLIKKERAELKPIYENYEFQSYADLEEELDAIRQSHEYQMHVESNPDHNLVRKVNEMIELAPGLLKYEGLYHRYKEQMLKVTELEQFYKATCEDLERLRLNEKYVLDSSFEGRGDFNLNMSAQFHKPLSSSPSGATISHNDSSVFSAISRNSAMPLVHVENYFQKS